jgi:hypothetical protein
VISGKILSNFENFVLEFDESLLFSSFEDFLAELSARYLLAKLTFIRPKYLRTLFETRKYAEHAAA